MTRRRAPVPAGVELTVTAIGARGDGLARDAAGPIYLPFTVPGDRVRACIASDHGEGRSGVVSELLAEGPGRSVPRCPHFGACGGCALQHLDAALYRATKEALLVEALARRGLAGVPLRPLLVLPPGTRRRVRFTITRSPSSPRAPRLGFAARASHDIVDLTACHVLDPALFRLAAPLRRLAAELLPPGATAHATLQRVDSGVDALLDLPEPPGLAALERLAGFTEAEDLARLSWRSRGDAPVPVAQRRPALLRLGGVALDLPVDGFQQATPEGEAALLAAAREAIGPARRIADLFAGLGTFSFPLAAAARVHAVEGSGPAVAAVNAAARRAGIADRVTAEARDLFQRPLLADELKPFDAVLFDPPRVGAKAQAAALAAATVPRLAAVSCNPASFARDARLLINGGYRLLWVQPIDQFIWSPHLELVAAFARP